MQSARAWFRRTPYTGRRSIRSGCGASAACVEMETSAVFSVSAYLGIKAAAALVVSDVHPTDEGAPDWHWHMDGDMRRAALERVVSAVVDEVV